MKKYLPLLGLCFCFCNAAEFAPQQQLLRAQVVMIAALDNPGAWREEEQKPKHSAKPLEKPNQKNVKRQKQQNKIRIYQPSQRGRKR